ncbi:MAG: DUF4239 domain-containing protein [Candidatus Binatus sp.]|uniref:bestrophin-like domain n=1 Tax=Candidatus Binatus sp. TaxID=2811406 RepID=UPI002721BFE6|nr:DUF4239 domain-containing protein [Candidatus Binatus sp.]MDO8431649.1 DUF4239 domain-containing protein [Candidatus Binatus sp.]
MNWLDAFSVSLQAEIVALVFAGVTIAGLLIMRRLVPWETLRENHEVAGFTFGVVGAFYGVVLAFVIVAAWQRYESANESAQQEALALANIFYLSRGFNEPMRSEMRSAVHQYARIVVNNEWEAMAKNDFAADSATANRLWDDLVAYKPADSRESLLLDKSLDQMADLNNARRLRYVYYSNDLPSVVWIVIYVGSVITIGFSYFFGTRYYYAQALMCGAFAALIGLTILAISELSTPYQGAVHVSSDAFRAVLAGVGSPGSTESQPR